MSSKIIFLSLASVLTFGCATEDEPGTSLSIEQFTKGETEGSAAISISHNKIPCENADGCLAIRLANNSGTPVAFDKTINNYSHKWGVDAKVTVSVTIVDGGARYTAAANVETTPVSKDAKFTIAATDMKTTDGIYSYLGFKAECETEHICSLLSDAIFTDGATASVSYNDDRTALIVTDVVFHGGEA